MCIIAVKSEKLKFTHAQLAQMWRENPHGAGIMWADGSKVFVTKGLMQLSDLEDAVAQIGPLRKMVLHFRIKTHGAISPELTHPFWIIENELAMAHNGVIRAVTNETTELESDTAVFARKLAAAYVNPMVALKNSFHREMIEAYIGYSKLVFMDKTGETFILNEELGTWSGSVWYSNDSFKEPIARAKSVVNDTRAAVQRRLEAAFGVASDAPPRPPRGSENANQKPKQVPLLGVAMTQPRSTWVRNLPTEK
jgi:hypothetical protein